MQTIAKSWQDQPMQSPDLYDVSTSNPDTSLPSSIKDTQSSYISDNDSNSKTPNPFNNQYTQHAAKTKSTHQLQ